jgi:hypothetical protein
MTIKDKLKKEIDQMPDELLYQIQKYLNSIKKTSTSRKKIKRIHLYGQYDNMNIRHRAYE